MNRERGDRGFTVLELMIAMGIMLGVTGVIFSLISPSQGSFRVQPEVADMQQRMRVAADMLYKDLLMAGTGTCSGSAVGALTKFFAPVLPHRTGKIDPDSEAGVYFHSDAISVTYVPQTSAQTAISDPMPKPSAEIKVEAQPGCPQNDPLCGFEAGQTVLIFDDTGAWDTFTITNVQNNALHLQHQGSALSKAYDVGAYITQAETHTYYLDSINDQLRHYDGWEGDLPLVDDVVGLSFRYFGELNALLEPKPPVGIENCLFDASGNSKLPVIPGYGSLTELTESTLTDGPWCGPAGKQFDADLYRVRTIRVGLRLQVTAEDLRGTDPTLFKRPASSRSATRRVPDYEMGFEVTPRNMNLAR